MTQYSRLALALLCASAVFHAEAYAKVEVAAQHDSPAQARSGGAEGNVQNVSWSQGGMGDNGDGIARASDEVTARARPAAATAQEGPSYVLLLGAAGALLVFGRRRQNNDRWRTIKVEHKD
jgi:hypothetical protein